MENGKDEAIFECGMPKDAPPTPLCCTLSGSDKCVLMREEYGAKRFGRE